MFKTMTGRNGFAFCIDYDDHYIYPIRTSMIYKNEYHSKKSIYSFLGGNSDPSSFFHLLNWFIHYIYGTITTPKQTTINVAVNICRLGYVNVFISSLQIVTRGHYST